MVTAMILAGGMGTRVGKECPKQFVEILDKPVLAYTIEIYQNYPGVDNVEVVCHSSWIDYCTEMVKKYNLTKVKWIVPAGETFQDSVINGVHHLEGLLGKEIQADDYVMLHYGASPFTSEKIVTDVIRVMKLKGSSVSATPCYQLMGSNDDGRTSKNYIDRDKYIQLACPFGFKFSYLLEVYKRAEKEGLLDVIEPHTTSLIYALGDTLYQAYSDQTNIKITTKEDLDMFEGYVLMKQRKHNLKNK